MKERDENDDWRDAIKTAVREAEERVWKKAADAVCDMCANAGEDHYTEHADLERREDGRWRHRCEGCREHPRTAIADDAYSVMCNASAIHAARMEGKNNG